MSKHFADIETIKITKIAPVSRDVFAKGRVGELAEAILKDGTLAIPLQLWSQGDGKTQTYRADMSCQLATAAVQEANLIDPDFEYVNCFIDVDFSDQNRMLSE